MNGDVLNVVGRRNFLLYCAMGFLGVTSGQILVNWWKESFVKSPYFARLARNKGVRAIGETYLSAHPHESTSSAIRALRSLGEARIRAQIAQDFERGNVVSLKGWILSRTECRVCVLAILTT